MKTLLQSYGLKCEISYYEMIVKSVIAEKMDKAKQLFSVLPFENKKEFIKSLYRDYHAGLSLNEKETFINLL